MVANFSPYMQDINYVNMLKNMSTCKIILCISKVIMLNDMQVTNILRESDFYLGKITYF